MLFIPRLELSLYKKDKASKEVLVDYNLKYNEMTTTKDFNQ